MKNPLDNDSILIEEKFSTVQIPWNLASTEKAFIPSETPLPQKFTILGDEFNSPSSYVQIENNGYCTLLFRKDGKCREFNEKEGTLPSFFDLSTLSSSELIVPYASKTEIEPGLYSASMNEQNETVLSKLNSDFTVDTSEKSQIIRPFKSTYWGIVYDQSVPLKKRLDDFKNLSLLNAVDFADLSITADDLKGIDFKTLKRIQNISLSGTSSIQNKSVQDLIFQQFIGLKEINFNNSNKYMFEESIKFFTLFFNLTFKYPNIKFTTNKIYLPKEYQLNFEFFENTDHPQQQFSIIYKDKELINTEVILINNKTRKYKISIFINKNDSNNLIFERINSKERQNYIVDIFKLKCIDAIYNEKEDDQICGVIYNVGEHPSCGVKEYKLGQCGVEKYKRGRNEVCGIEIYNEKRDYSICGSEWMKTDTTYKYYENGPIRNNFDISGDSHPNDYCKSIGYDQGVGIFIGTEDQYGDNDNSVGLITKNKFQIYCERGKLCRHETFGAQLYKECENPVFGVETYKYCRKEEFNVESYNICEHVSFGIKSSKSCRNQAFGIQTCLKYE